MCAPAVLPLALSLGQFAIGAVSSFAQYRGQQQVADNQAQYQANLASLEQERYLREQTQLQQQYSQEVLSRQMQLSQEREATARELMGVSKEARAVRSKIKVASGEAGVQGASIDGLLDEVTRQELGYFEAQARQSQLRDQAFSINAQNLYDAKRTNSSNGLFASQMRVASINRPVEKPYLSVLGTNLFSQGLSATNSYFSNKYYQTYGAGSGQTTDLVSGLFGV
jgi:hypothetical protein